MFNDDLVPPRLPEVCVLYDMDAFSNTVKSLKTAFSSGSYEAAKFTHCFAVKSCPLSYILYDAVKKGLGLEAASLNEVLYFKSVYGIIRFHFRNVASKTSKNK
jgi:diaminopimelate decarboxylase